MKKWLIVAVLSCFGQTVQADLQENHETRVAFLYQTYVPTEPPPVPSVPISLFVDKPDKQTQREILKAIDDVNALRIKGGLLPLHYDENLSAYAQLRASEIEQKFSHERPNGEMYRTSMGIGRAVGENIAAGKASANDAILQFKNSEKHYKTLMRTDYTKIGMGMVHVPQSRYKYYWVQIFGADNTYSPAQFK